MEGARGQRTASTGYRPVRPNIEDTRSSQVLPVRRFDGDRRH
nr:hypothetical protein [Kibdelosporangium sp. MJ126-NF4]